MVEFLGGGAGAYAHPPTYILQNFHQYGSDVDETFRTLRRDLKTPSLKFGDQWNAYIRKSEWLKIKNLGNFCNYTSNYTILT